MQLQVKITPCIDVWKPSKHVDTRICFWMMGCFCAHVVSSLRKMLLVFTKHNQYKITIYLLHFLTFIIFRERSAMSKILCTFYNQHEFLIEVSYLISIAMYLWKLFLENFYCVRSHLHKETKSSRRKREIKFSWIT